MTLLLVSPQSLVPMEISFLIYRLMIFPLISQGGTPLPTILSSNKVHHRASPNNPQQSSPRTKYTIESPLRPMEPSNNLPLIKTRLLLWSPQTKYTICSTPKSLLTTPRLTTILFDT